MLIGDLTHSLAAIGDLTHSLAAVDPLTIAGAVSGVVGAIVGGFSMLRSASADKQAADVSDRTMAREEMESLIAELRRDNDEVRAEVRELRGENRQLHDDVDRLRTDIGRCHAERARLALELAAIRGE